MAHSASSAVCWNFFDALDYDWTQCMYYFMCNIVHIVMWSTVTLLPTTSLTPVLSWPSPCCAAPSWLRWHHQDSHHPLPSLQCGADLLRVVPRVGRGPQVRVPAAHRGAGRWHNSRLHFSIVGWPKGTCSAVHVQILCTMCTAPCLVLFGICWMPKAWF